MHLFHPFLPQQLITKLQDPWQNIVEKNPLESQHISVFQTKDNTADRDWERLQTLLPNAPPCLQTWWKRHPKTRVSTNSTWTTEPSKWKSCYHWRDPKGREVSVQRLNLSLLGCRLMRHTQKSITCGPICWASPLFRTTVSLWLRWPCHLGFSKGVFQGRTDSHSWFNILSLLLSTSAAQM